MFPLILTNISIVGPVIVGPTISIDDWVPERPPKNATLLNQIYPDTRAVSPELPPPPLPSKPSESDVVMLSDEPLPPPPLPNDMERLMNTSKDRSQNRNSVSSHTQKLIVNGFVTFNQCNSLPAKPSLVAEPPSAIPLQKR